MTHGSLFHFTSNVTMDAPGPSVRRRGEHRDSPLHLTVPPSEGIFQTSPENSRLRLAYEPGCLPDQVYDRELPAWRARIRRILVKRLRDESEGMARWQKRVRSEGRDRYFYWTAIFGTHTFFLTFLPIFFFSGHTAKGRGMLSVVGFGIYLSSCAKDLMCCPRPYSPPLIRLSMSTHADEYGFLSSHSTNTITVALYLAQWLWEVRKQTSTSTLLVGFTVLLIYAASVVGGRLYTGMHSTADVIVGSLLGAACWAIWLVIGDWAEWWLQSGSLSVPIVLLPLTLFLIHYHPEPVEDCPCFEDSIAILSVMLGVYVGGSVFGSGLMRGVGIVVLRFVLGIGTLFAWRIVVKNILLRVLPPTFRATSRVLSVDLPTRKHYTAATDYPGSPPADMHPVPSFIDLHIGRSNTPVPSADGGSSDSDFTPSPISHSSAVIPDPHTFSSYAASVSDSLSPQTGPKARSLTSAHSDAAGSVTGVSKRDGHSATRATSRGRSKREKKTRGLHYDAEVLTKFGVYTGIGYLAAVVVEGWFDAIERRWLV
ncbi:hypothetical protein TREMEDRAFT_74652 [Tremella mesenterica DSM 1558]|uniref:uncharacterized protein n=1 Tax=Tremella mesenterica (strain ATCC 24925 / CBS 8224 / DSM 1558 / NBRC 9311 / NRRL Y-6157 / RJB 2259-6 / UBC 559-6) TaxID=578456 RepID=UPI0003F4A1FB|nr:uncharacterized protein TREMEDRAFT_74652 [Tremella mesenterica DSM 1558]EIW67130.1 hypothetical protein TREMEDRAFT_74652 [Tremella mesenterica DSM 1558]